jgi:hypothetical protein
MQKGGFRGLSISHYRNFHLVWSALLKLFFHLCENVRHQDKPLKVAFVGFARLSCRSLVVLKTDKTRLVIWLISAILLVSARLTEWVESAVSFS